MADDNILLLQQNVFNVKKRMLDMANACGQRTHLGGSMSIVELLTVLYKNILNIKASDPEFPGRDRFILSKGHCVLAYYAVLAECGFLNNEDLDSFQQNGGILGAHPSMNLDKGIESSNGSLGQGLGMAIGLAKAAKLKNEQYETYVLCGNGECNEGAIWEAAMLAPQWKLDNLTVIIDNNGMQSDGDSRRIIEVSNWAERWRTFGFDAVEIDGHDIGQILGAYRRPKNGMPKVILANTIKGHGISFMENNNEWHHNRLTDKLYNQACEELGVE